MKEAYVGGLSSHFSRNKTYDLLCQHFYWPRIKGDVDAGVKRCAIYRRSKSRHEPFRLYMSYLHIIR